MVSKRIWSSKQNEQKWFIVFDGTSHYAELGMDIQQDIDWGDIDEDSIVEGPFTDDDKLEDRIEQLNDEAYGTHMYR